MTKEEMENDLYVLKLINDAKYWKDEWARVDADNCNLRALLEKERLRRGKA